MMELESSLHLSQPPLYRSTNRSWHRSYAEAIQYSGDSLIWDPAAILSILSFNYVCGDRTLLKEIKRRPWLSKIGEDSEPILEDIPAHHNLWLPYEEISENLESLLCDEAERVCRGHSELYIMLTGGMDSRVSAGILAKLYREKRIGVKPIAVTWGLPDCRDVVYGQAIAKLLGFEWVHVELGPEDILFNIAEAVYKIGYLVPPVHLHRKSWFKNVSNDALVIASSYGDSVGRAEFSKNRLLELNYLRPYNFYNLLHPEVLPDAVESLNNELRFLHSRTPDKHKYVICEHEMAAHYMRGMISHAMDIINHYCSVYQMFTHPSVYSYMWAIHPALRFDEIYYELLNQLDPKLAQFPWARTNKAIKGKTIGSLNGLKPKFHDYNNWISGQLYDNLVNSIDLDWLASTGLFDISSVKRMVDSIRKKPTSFRPYELLTWLAGFRRFSVWLNDLGVEVNYKPSTKSSIQNTLPTKSHSNLRQSLNQITILHKIVKNIRIFILRWKARLIIPHERLS